MKLDHLIDIAMGNVFSGKGLHDLEEQVKDPDTFQPFPSRSRMKKKN